MRHYIARIRGVGFIFWQARHYLYHITLGLLWAWFLRERWNMFSMKWLWTAVAGSIIPDIDHMVYFLTYGKHDWYNQQIRKFLRTHQWRNLTVFMANGHKYNTSLVSHNYFVMAFLFGLSVLSSFFDWEVGVVLFGAMLIHYLFDIFDDLVILGSVNPNWKRWGKPKRTTASVAERKQV